MSPAGPGGCSDNHSKPESGLQLNLNHGGLSVGEKWGEGLIVSILGKLDGRRLESQSNNGNVSDANAMVLTSSIYIHAAITHISFSLATFISILLLFWVD